MRNRIDNILSVIKSARDWDVNIDENKRFDWRVKLTNIERQLLDIRSASKENCSVAAFGESQMGKSYLVSAMLSDPGTPFSVKGGDKIYNFIDEINPSAPNSAVEATGVVTRFSSLIPQDDRTPNGWLKVKILSLSDIVLILAEAYYNQVVREHRDIIAIIESINNRIKECSKQNNANPILTEVDVLNIKDYLSSTRTIGTNCDHIIRSSELFNFLLQNIRNIGNEDIVSLLKFIWNNNKSFNRLFDDMVKIYRELTFASECYVSFKSVLRKHGSLLDVARLDEMYSAPDAVGQYYESEATLKLQPEGSECTLPKSFLSALIAELNFVVDNKRTEEKSFVNNLDILDFPGWRSAVKDAIKEDELCVEKFGKNISTVFRRGKVTYLFNKYSRSKRITSLLFCHNNNQSTTGGALGPVLSDWVNTNIGNSFDARRNFVTKTIASPLMIISTWFNKDLEYNNERTDADLGERWNRRFKTVLSNEVLQSNKSNHWFNNWISNNSPFRSIFMLRDFKFSKTIFRGYDPDKNQPEKDVIKDEKFPDYMEKLKLSFVDNDFVRNHFEDPASHWMSSATPTNDGTRAIINHLNKLAPNVKDARNQKFDNDYKNLIDELLLLLNSEYHDDDPVEQTKKAKKEVGKIILNIDRHCGNDPYFCSRLLETMMIPERLIREKIFTQIKGRELIRPLSKPETEIFMAAGLSTEESPTENLNRLCEYLGVDDRSECEEILQEQDNTIDIDNLLGQECMVESIAEQLLSSIENLWQTEFLSIKVLTQTEFPEISTIVAKLISLYRELDVHKILLHEVQHLMDTIVADKQVGILSSWLTMSMNKFVGEFGYSYISEEMLSSVGEKNRQFKLNIDMDLIKPFPPKSGIELLQQIDTVQHRLEIGGFTSEVREQQKELPRYRSRWQWQNRMRVGFAIVSGLRDYNIDANNEIKQIINSIQ